MCGPIALAVAPASSSRWPIVDALLHYLGRIATYGIVGAAAGAAASGAARLAPLARAQRRLHLTLALLLATFAATLLGAIGPTRWSSAL
jgi:sulfite exporter TauE/SafE